MSTGTPIPDWILKIATDRAARHGIVPPPSINNKPSNPIRPPPRATPASFPVPSILAETGAAVSAPAQTPTPTTAIVTSGPLSRVPRPIRLSRIAALNPNGGKYLYNLKVTRVPTETLSYVSLPAAPPTLSASVDLRSRFPAVYDQGALGSCTANALCGAFAFDAPGFTGSRLFLYYNERVIENDVKYDAGAYLHDGITALKTYGVCAESLWPYLINKYATKPTTACYTAALSDKVITAQNIPPVLATMKQALSQGYPFVFGFTVYSSFESKSATATGIIPMPSSHDYILGGHAVVAVGYDDAHQWFIFRNSWGSGWGAGGYGFISYAYLSNSSLTSDLWYITSVKK